MREVKIDIYDILELVWCAYDYELPDPVDASSLLDGYASLLGHQLSVEEIDEYYNKTLSLENMTIEDCSDIKETLIRFKEFFMEPQSDMEIKEDARRMKAIKDMLEAHDSGDESGYQEKMKKFAQMYYPNEATA